MGRGWQLMAVSVLAVTIGHTAAVLYAATPVMLNTSDPTNYFFGFDASVPLSEDVDVVSIHDDFYGVPWAAFLAAAENRTATLPVSWMGRLNATLAAVTAWDKPVFLTIQMLSGTLRTCPAQNATDGPADFPVVTPFADCDSCFDFSSPSGQLVQRAHLLYASFMVQAFAQHSPRGLAGVNFAPEVNLGARLCSDSWWQNVVQFSNSAYSLLKEVLLQQGMPSVPVFPSFQLEVVYGLQTGPDQPCVGMMGDPAPSAALLQCLADGLALVAPVARDRFAVSTYPHNQEAGFPKQFPHWQPWYLPTALQHLGPSDKAGFIIAETGYVSDTIVVNLNNGTVGAASTSTSDPPPICAPILNASVADANAWLSYVIAQAELNDFTMVTWWSDMDLLYNSSMNSCPCAVPPAFEASCTFISAYRQIEAALIPGGAVYGEINAKSFGTMGLRGNDGSPKPLWSTLQQARARATQNG